MEENFSFIFNLSAEMHPNSTDKQQPACRSLTSAVETFQEVGRWMKGLHCPPPPLHRPDLTFIFSNTNLKMLNLASEAEHVQTRDEKTLWTPPSKKRRLQFVKWIWAVVTDIQDHQSRRYTIPNGTKEVSCDGWILAQAAAAEIGMWKWLIQLVSSPFWALQNS